MFMVQKQKFCESARSSKMSFILCTLIPIRMFARTKKQAKWKKYLLLHKISGNDRNNNYNLPHIFDLSNHCAILDTLSVALLK